MKTCGYIFSISLRPLKDGGHDLHW